ncbi:MAG: LPS assembly protein LptD, partial [Planctomycetota bacterium]
TFLSKWRLNDFQNATEKLPEVSYHLVGEPVVDEKDHLKWLENLYFSSHSSAGQNRRRVSTVDGEDTLNRTAWRADTDNQLNYPFTLGVLNLNPALGLRLTSYEESIFEKKELTRVSGLAQFNMATHFYRNYTTQSKWLEINNLQHIITPRLEYLDIFGTTHSPDELIQFDEADTVNDVRVLRLGILNRLKTWRGEEKKRKAEEFLYFDLSLPFYPNENRDNEGKDFGNLDYRARWFITQKLALLSDGEYNFSAGKMDVFNIGMSYRFLPNSLLFLGNRYIREDSSIMTFSFNYDFSERWSLRLLEQYDFTNREFTEQKLVLTRYFHRFIVDFEFDRDEGENNVGFKVALTTVDLEGTRKKKYEPQTIPTIELLERMSRNETEEDK